MALGSMQKSPGRQSNNVQDRPSLRLPPEIVLAMLDVTQQPIVLTIASVCRAWRAGAVSHRNYYLYIPLYRCPYHARHRSPNPAPSPRYALDALSQAVRRGTPVSLELNLKLVSFRDCCTYFTGKCGWVAMRDAFVMRSIFHIVCTALQSSIVKISITFENLSLIMRLLGSPAPRLESLTCIRDSHFYFDAENTLKPEIFEGHAPRLREVTLRGGIYTTSTPIPAFRTVVSARFTTAHTVAWPIASHFPNLTALDLTIIPHSHGGQFQLSVDYLVGARLQRLRLTCDQSRECAGVISTPLPNVPYLEVSGFIHADVGANIRELVYPCSLEIDYARFPDKKPPWWSGRQTEAHIAVFSSPARMLRMTLECSDAWPQALPLVKSLRIAQRAVRVFFQSVQSHTVLPSLTVLTLDVTSIDDLAWPALENSTVSCPALCELNITWRGTAKDPLDAYPFICAYELDSIARTLSLARSQDGVRPGVLLRLHGLVYNPADNLIDHPSFYMSHPC